MMYDGKPHLEEIGHAKAAVSIPVIANGGIFSAEDAVNVMERTGADGIMVARYGLENPFIFSELTGKDCKKTAYTLLEEQLELTARHYEETFVLGYMKKLAAYMMKKRRGTKQYKQRLYQSGSLAELREVIALIFAENAA